MNLFVVLMVRLLKCWLGRVVRLVCKVVISVLVCLFLMFL